MLVPYLKVPIAWRVGFVTFRPPGWLRRRLERDVSQSTWADSADLVLREVRDSEWSSASVVVTARIGAPVPGDEARLLVEDAIALARLYQRACLPVLALDHQTFGLPPDIDSATLVHWLTGSKGYAGHGWTRLGVLGGFEFRKDWIKKFRARAAFAYLDDALRGPIPPKGSWQQRSISALRALNLASPLRSQSTRIPLQAVALEALLGDDPSTVAGEFRPQAHPIAQRAAYLTCPVDGLQLEAGKSACLHLWARSARQVDTHSLYANRKPDRFDWPCSAYWEMRQVFYDRNRAMHDAADDFPKNTAMRYEGRVDDVLLATLDWAAETRAAGIADLDKAIAGLPTGSLFAE
jgi:hypothetical protein